jgi:Arc/MetJ-type ribon-helix-helix transcriptional regulator
MSATKARNKNDRSTWAESDDAIEAVRAALASRPAPSKQDATEAGRAAIEAALPRDPKDDTPAEAFARAELIRLGRGPGRPSLTGGPGKSIVRQVRLPRDLDARLELAIESTHRKRSELVRAALENYLRKIT